MSVDPKTATPEEFKAGLDAILKSDKNAKRTPLLIKLCEEDLQRLRIASKEVCFTSLEVFEGFSYQGIRLLSSRELPPGEVDITFLDRGE